MPDPHLTPPGDDLAPRFSRAGKDCPACDRDIGVWPVFSAGMPNWIRCPGCGRRLRYENAGRVYAVLIGLGLVIAGGLLYLIRPWSIPDQALKRLLLYCGAILLIWTVVELLTTLHLRHWYSLAVVEPPTVKE